MALKGIRWDDKKYFFEALEDSVKSLAELEDNDKLKQSFVKELAVHDQRIENYKMMLGHKNLILNLCHELQSTNFDEFNGRTVQVSAVKRPHSEIVVRKPPEEHGYSRENENAQRKKAKVESPVKPEPDQTESIQYIYESGDDDEGSQFEQEYLEELEPYEEETEIVEYQEVHPEEIETDENGIYTSEQIVKNEADQFEQSGCFEISGYESSSSQNRSGSKNKKPKHMYTSEFLQTQMTQGRIGVPGRRRPKIQKHYPDTEEGLLERWADLVRQSCEVIVPSDLLSQHNLDHIDLLKLQENIWEVKCPLCSKKLRLQLTFEGKYTNYKRSNFERHLRIVHYKQIVQFKPEEEPDEEPMYSIEQMAMDN